MASGSLLYHVHPVRVDDGHVSTGAASHIHCHLRLRVGRPCIIAVSGNELRISPGLEGALGHRRSCIRRHSILSDVLLPPRGTSFQDRSFHLRSTIGDQLREYFGMGYRQNGIQLWHR